MQATFRRSYATHAGKHHRRKPKQTRKSPIDPARKQYLVEHHRYRDHTEAMKAEEIIKLKTARRNIREDYELGPLKPWRDADPKYALWSQLRHERRTVKPERDRLKDWFFRKGDRVCVVSGRPGVVGQIGMIREIRKTQDTVVVEGVNTIETKVPEMSSNLNDDNVTKMEEPIPVSNIRLVYPMQDPDTGEYRDCILGQLERRNVRRDEFRSFDPEEQRVFDRYLMPQNLRIPWPDENEEEVEERNEPGDTLRAEVEEKSFLPTLLRPPMPEDALQELRDEDKDFDANMRGLFDAEHVEARIARLEEKQQLKEIKKDLVPPGARNMARKGRGADGTFLRDPEVLPQFDNQTLRTIARHMRAAQRKQQLAQASRESDISAGPATPSHASSN